MDFVKEIPVVTKPDCHATSLDNSYLYIACLEGLYCTSQKTLEVEKVLTEIGLCYATNTMPNGAIVRFFDVASSNKYIISSKEGKYEQK